MSLIDVICNRTRGSAAPTAIHIVVVVYHLFIGQSVVRSNVVVVIE